MILWGEIQTFDSIYFGLYGARPEKQKPQGNLYCKVKTLQYSGEHSNRWMISYEQAFVKSVKEELPFKFNRLKS